jgi:ankyrin repeat protein
MDEMKEIIDSKTTNINFAGTEGVTPLMWAMKAGNKKAFLKLLKSGANPNSATGKGKYGSVIFYALRFEKDPYYLETALKNGGNPNLVYDDTTPMYYAMDFDDDITKLKMLVAAGADVNSCGEGQDIPIVVACGLNQYDAVLFLLENGADYSKKNMFNNDLRYALKENLTNPYFAPYGEMLENLIKVVDFLEKKGVDVKEFRELIEKRRKK